MSHKKKKKTQKAHLPPHEQRVLRPEPNALQHEECLLEAIQAGDVGTVWRMLKEGTPVNDISMVTPLHYAAYYGKIEVMEMLVNSGADLNISAQYRYGFSWENEKATPLGWAIKSGQKEAALWLIDHGADVTVPISFVISGFPKSPIVTTLLLLALTKGWSDVATACIAHGADITVQAKNHRQTVSYSVLDFAAYYNCLELLTTLLEPEMDGTSALFLAIEQGHDDVAQLLLTSRIDWHARNRHGNPIPHAAFRHQMYWLVEIWLTYGGDPNLQNQNGETLLHYAFSADDCIALQPMAVLLRRYGANLGIRDMRDTTPLHWAAKHGFGEWVEEWITQGGDLNIYSEVLETPLFAALPAYPDVALLLIRHGAHLNHEGIVMIDSEKSLWTPLHIAANAGLSEVVRALLEHGAEVNPYNTAGETPLVLAVNAGHLETVRCLCEHGAIFPTFTMFQRYELQNALLFLTCGIIPDASDGDARYLDIATVLMESGERLLPGKETYQKELNEGFHQLILREMTVAEIVTWADQYGFTALHYATERGELLLTRLLLQHGADVRAVTAYGYTPLHYAARHDNMPLVKLLLEAGADPDARLSRGRLQGWTALRFAMSYQHPRVIRLLAPVSPQLSKAVKAGSHAITGAYQAYYGSQPRLKDEIEHTAFRCPACHERMVYNTGFEMDGSGVHADRWEYFLCGNCNTKFWGVAIGPYGGHPVRELRPWASKPRW